MFIRMTVVMPSVWMSTDEVVRSSQITRQISREWFLLTQGCRAIVEQTLLEQWLDKSTNRNNFLGKTPSAFIAEVIHTNAPMLGLDKQATIDIINSIVESLNEKLVNAWHIVVDQVNQILKDSDITQSDIESTLLLLHALSEELTKKNTCFLSEIKGFDTKNALALRKILETLNDHKAFTKADTAFTNLYWWRLGWRTQFLLDTSSVGLFIRNIHLYTMLEQEHDMVIKTERIQQALDLGMFYLEQQETGRIA